MHSTVVGGSLIALGCLIFVAYISCILNIALAFYSSPNSSTRRLYWFVPPFVVFIVAGLIALGEYFSPGISGMRATLRLAILALIVPCYGLHFMYWRGYIFRCGFCGLTTCTYENWWRSGAYWCPGCNRLYSFGHHREH